MSEPQITWGAGLTPEELAARLAAHPFAAVREPLMDRITLAALAESIKVTPNKSGHLRRSEAHRVEPGGLRGWIGSNVIYAPFVHDGTENEDGSVRMKARPFFSQGIENSSAKRQQLLEAAGDDYLQGLV